jgi:hypothetical protein
MVKALGGAVVGRGREDYRQVALCEFLPSFPKCGPSGSTTSCFPCSLTLPNHTDIRPTKRTIETRRKQQTRHLRLGQPDKSADAQHALETGCKIDFNNTCRLARTKGYMDRIIKEAIEIKLHPDFNRGGGFILSRAWQPAIHQIRTSHRGMGAQQLTARPPT